MVYYKNPQNQQVYAYDPVTQQELINQAIVSGWTLITNWPLPPTDAELMAQCKTTASEILYQTDWTSIPDVANPSNNPYLTNQEEFLAYRSVIRGYAVNPVPHPAWPTPPTAIWS
jgi:hypothetical protein